MIAKTITNAGTTVIVNRGTIKYWVPKFQLILDASLIINSTVFVVPDLGTLPVPVQPLQTARVTRDVCAEDGIEAFTDVPASNQSVVGEGEPEDAVTVNKY